MRTPSGIAAVAGAAAGAVAAAGVGAAAAGGAPAGGRAPCIRRMGGDGRARKRDRRLPAHRGPLERPRIDVFHLGAKARDDRTASTPSDRSKATLNESVSSILHDAAVVNITIDRHDAIARPGRQNVPCRQRNDRAVAGKPWIDPGICRNQLHIANIFAIINHCEFIRSFTIINSIINNSGFAYTCTVPFSESCF